MSKTVYLFSGQGSQYCGMGKDLYENFVGVRQIYECASDILGVNVAQLSFEGDDTEISQTRLAQPLIYTHSLAALEAAKEFAPSPCAVAGHSLGEYAALTCAGVMSREDGFRVIGARAAAMQKAAEQNPGGMAAVIGSDPDTIQSVCDNTSGYVLPVNFNSPSQTVIAGENSAIQAAVDTFTQMGVKTVRLAVGSAFHSKMMAGAAEEFSAGIQNITFLPLNIPFYSNVYGTCLTELNHVRDYLALHLTSPVRFTDEVSAMIEEGVDTFIEFGPNRVLTTLVKKSVKGVTACNVEDMKTLGKAKETLSR